MSDPTGYDVLGRVTSGLLLLPAWVALVVWRGFILALLWGWFVTPVTGSPAPPVALCIGLALTLRMALGIRKGEDKKPSLSREWSEAVESAIAHAIALGIAYLIHLCV